MRLQSEFGQAAATETIVDERGKCHLTCFDGLYTGYS